VVVVVIVIVVVVWVCAQKQIDIRYKVSCVRIIIDKKNLII